MILLECCSVLLAKTLTVDYYFRLADQVPHSRKESCKIILEAERLNYQRLTTECINFIMAPVFYKLGRVMLTLWRRNFL